MKEHYVGNGVSKMFRAKVIVPQTLTIIAPTAGIAEQEAKRIAMENFGIDFDDVRLLELEEVKKKK